MSVGENVMSVIGENIKKLRDCTRVTQEQLADNLFVSYQAVSKWETGAAVPDTMMLPKIAEFFGTTIDELFRENMVAYRHKAERLYSIYQNCPSPENFAAAESALIKITENPTSPDCYFQTEDLRLLGNLYADHMGFCRDRAIVCYDKAIQSGRQLRASMYACFEQQKICFLAQIGRVQESIDRYLALIEEQPDDCENYICVVCAYFWAGQYEKALEYTEKALEKWIDNLMLWKLGGDVCRKLLQYDRAFQYWDKSLELNEKYRAETGANGFMEALFSKAEAYAELGEKSNAYTTWKEIAERLGEMGFSIEKEYAVKKMQEFG